jgi:hypothetical protein
MGDRFPGRAVDRLLSRPLEIRHGLLDVATVAIVMANSL